MNHVVLLVCVAVAESTHPLNALTPDATHCQVLFTNCIQIVIGPIPGKHSHSVRERCASARVVQVIMERIHEEYAVQKRQKEDRPETYLGASLSASCYRVITKL